MPVLRVLTVPQFLALAFLLSLRTSVKIAILHRVDSLHQLLHLGMVRRHLDVPEALVKTVAKLREQTLASLGHICDPILLRKEYMLLLTKVFQSAEPRRLSDSLSLLILLLVGLYLSQNLGVWGFFLLLLCEGERVEVGCARHYFEVGALGHSGSDSWAALGAGCLLHGDKLRCVKVVYSETGAVISLSGGLPRTSGRPIESGSILFDIVFEALANSTSSLERMILTLIERLDPHRLREQLRVSRELYPVSSMFDFLDVHVDILFAFELRARVDRRRPLRLIAVKLTQVLRSVDGKHVVLETVIVCVRDLDVPVAGSAKLIEIQVRNDICVRDVDPSVLLQVS